MLRNYFTLYHAALELRERLRGGRLEAVGRPNSHELALTFTTPEGEAFALVLFTHAPQLALFAHEGPAFAPKRTQPIWKELWGTEVEEVGIAAADREITITLADGRALLLQLFANRTNAFLVDNGAVKASFEPHRTEPAAIRTEGSILRELEVLAMEGPHPLPDSLPGFDSGLRRELLSRAGPNPSHKQLHAALQELFYELVDPLPQVGQDKQGMPTFSILHTPLDEGRSCNSVLEALEAYSKATLRTLHTRQELDRLQASLTRRINRIERELAGADPESLQREADEHERFGHLLTAAIGQASGEAESITVRDLFDPDMPEVAIALKEGLNIQQNAADRFARAAKARKGSAALQVRRNTLQAELGRLEVLLEESRSLDSARAVRRFLDNHRSELPEGTRKAKEKQARALPYRTVKLSDKATLLIGRNAAGNEQLTFEHARPDDIWLHARGSAGSHCILKGSSLDATDELLAAAAIAAWHSGAKHAELVPVMVTLRKYVRRSRHLPKGEVAVEREKILFVKPEKEST